MDTRRGEEGIVFGGISYKIFVVCVIRVCQMENLYYNGIIKSKKYNFNERGV
jgi:hypothetical protein